MKHILTLPRAASSGVNGFPDFFASIVVFLVALPLCMGIAIASGAPPAAGLISAVIGGIIVGSISGSPLQVSGPAAGLVVISYDLIERHGWQTFGVILALAGVLQLMAGILRLGLWFRAVSPAVVQGMLAGIGLAIFAAQFHVMLDARPQARVIDNLLAIPLTLWQGIFPLDSGHHWAALLGLITLAGIMCWKPLTPRAMHLVPAPLIGVLAAALLTWLFELPVKHIEIAPLHEALALPHWEMLAHVGSPAILLAAASVALIASAETLLCAAAVDKMHSRPELKTQYNRELAAQGIGNVLCGLFGGLPMTGVIVRSSANVQAGSKSRWSTILHGVWILLFAAAFPWLLSYVPLASLAAVLVYTGLKLVNVSAISDLAKYGKEQIPVCLATVTLIMVTDLLIGVLLGLALSAIALLHRLTTLEARISPAEMQGWWSLELAGTALFWRLPKLAWSLQKVPPGSRVTLDVSQLAQIDHACLDHIRNWDLQHRAAGGITHIDWPALESKAIWKSATSLESAGISCKSDRSLKALAVQPGGRAAEVGCQPTTFGDEWPSPRGYESCLQRSYATGCSRHVRRNAR